MGLLSLASKGWGLVELDLSNVMELTNAGEAAIAEVENLEKLLMARCKLVSDIGIGCIAVATCLLLLAQNHHASVLIMKNGKPEFGKWRTKLCPRYDEMETIFGNDAATGNASYATLDTQNHVNGQFLYILDE
ncbi:unnamed protein product [Fraxinus pennsylvanica]|uniref:Uncharacterized protein n=1 Tax=Fraxinus pennsylvanica TaxID=56036 RepID=A0AAD2E9U5_9LAMI|nr:unnamed protein product [Fraxinus pennsylvanica]